MLLGITFVARQECYDGNGEDHTYSALYSNYIVWRLLIYTNPSFTNAVVTNAFWKKWMGREKLHFSKALIKILVAKNFLTGP